MRNKAYIKLLENFIRISYGCVMCRGSGNLCWFKDGQPKYQTCPACEGNGTKQPHGNGTINGKKHWKEAA